MVTRLPIVCGVLLMIVLNAKSTPVAKQSLSKKLYSYNTTEISSLDYKQYNLREHTASKSRRRREIPFLKTGNKKYYLETTFKANWYKAMEYCLIHGMQLATIDSQKENNDLLKYIVDSGHEKERFWTSGTDLGEEGKFIWMANGRSVTFSYWGPTAEPNNIVRMGEGENCLEIADVGSGRFWNDIWCSLQSSFICQESTE